VIVRLRNPDREVVINKSMNVSGLLRHLGLNRESHLVIENGELVPRDRTLAIDAVVEIRPVISGGSQ